MHRGHKVLAAILVASGVALGASAVNHANVIKQQPSLLQPPVAQEPPTAQQTQRLGPPDIYPDPNLTPGVLLPDTSGNPQATICNHSWSTKSIRPPVSYTTNLKQQQLANGYNGYGDKNTKSYEEDHLCSLEIGGDPKDPKNLWPEPYNASIPDGGARQKDKLENYLHDQICAGAITPKQACDTLSKDWYKAYKETVGKYGQR